jgi:autotransporter-associated beta strand protein
MTPQASHLSAHTDSRRAAPRRRSRLRAILLATSALASAALPATVAHAADATWLTTQPPNDNDTGNFNNANHWDNGVPDGGNATFNDSDTKDITFKMPTTLGGITVTSGAGGYTFTTNQVELTFSGDGLSVQSGASLTLNVNAPVPVSFTGNSTAGQAQININASGADVQFSGTSTAGSSKLNVGNPAAPGGHAVLEFTEGSNAGQATITIVDGAEVDFKDSSKARQATIINGLGGKLFFTTSGAADQASIESDGSIFFQDQASGGTAGIKLHNNGVLDISGLTTTGTTVGSLEGSGNVSLGGKNLAVGGNNLSREFSGVIRDSGSGSLTKEGTGALTLSGINTYTGATVVSGGALVVDGSIASSASSSSVTVNGNGALAGIGFVPTTLVNPGGTLAPGHSDGTFGTLTVQGSLTFTAAATYLIQVSPATAANTHVTGTATLGGATVAANFAPGTYVKQQYGILHANGGLNSTSFRSLVSTTNLSPMFKATLSYDANDVFLNLDAVAPDANSGLNTNQRNVANAIVNSRNLTGGTPFAFATLAPAGLTQISGETAVGSQQATFDAMNQFMGVMLDPTVGALSGGRAFAQANDAYASIARKAPVAAEPFAARWNVWAAGFGGSQSISGDAVLGSNKTTSNVFGTAAGAEYRFSPNTVAGFALAGGGTHFNVANGGSGNSDLFQAGAYLRHTQGAAFLAAALAYGWQDVTTNRTVTVAGIDNLRGRFNANAVSGRLEGGYRVATAAGDLTPYAAGQFTTYRLPSYVEQATAGANTFALAYNGKDVTATRTELGLRSEEAVALTDATLMLRGRLAWAHDFNTDRNVQAAFVTLPGSAFVVNGAQPAADTALTTVSAEMLWRNGWSAAVTADAQLSDTTHSYSGKGVVRYSW